MSEKDPVLMAAAVMLFQEPKANMPMDSFMWANIKGVLDMMEGETNIAPIFVFKMQQGLSAWTARMKNLDDKRKIDKALRERVLSSHRLCVPAQSYFAGWPGWVGLASGKKDCIWMYGEVGDDRRLYYSIVERSTPLGPLHLKVPIEVKEEIGEGLFLNMLYGPEADGGSTP